MKAKITLNNIKSFIEGNTQMLLDGLGLKEDYYKEQIAYRQLMCKDDCVPKGACKYCGCSLPGKFYATKSCNNGIKFPDLMEEEEWNNFKIKNGIN